MASVTKAMSATLLMTLVDRGLVGLDDDVGKYFPSLKGIEVKAPLRVRHLLTQGGWPTSPCTTTRCRTWRSGWPTPTRT